METKTATGALIFHSPRSGQRRFHACLLRFKHNASSICDPTVPKSSANTSTGFFPTNANKL